MVARIVTEHMSKTLGQQLVIENVGGAGGTLGSARVAAAAPDGYTLLAGSMGSHVAAPVLTPNLKYDPARTSTAIGFTAHSPAVIAARKDFPAKDAKEFVAYLKKNGDKVKQAHGGVGASSHMACLVFNTAARHQADAGGLSRHRPGRERPGRRPYRFPLRAVGERRRADQGRHQSRATWCRRQQRLAVLPDVPSAKEAGINYDMSIWAGIFAPKGVTKEVVDKLAAALNKALDDPGGAETARRSRRIASQQGGAQSRGLRQGREGGNRALVAHPQGGEDVGQLESDLRARIRGAEVHDVRLRVAALGMGWWSDVLADAAKRSGAIEIVACFTRSPDKRQRLRQQVRLQRRRRAMRRFWRTRSIEAIVNTTPNNVHLETTRRPRRAGKHVFLDKPIANTVAEGAEIAEFCEKAGVVLALGYQRRRESHFRWIKREIDAGRFGKLVQAEGNISRDRLGQFDLASWRYQAAGMPGGVMLQIGIHYVDVLEFLMGPVKRVSGMSAQLVLPGDNPDVANLILEHESGAISNLTASYASASDIT